MEYKEFRGIRVSEAELREYQRLFPSGDVAQVVGRIVERVGEYWRLRLVDLDVGDPGVRQAQGALSALGSVGELGAYLAQVSWDAENVVEDEDQDEGGIDVRF